jgi:hypothetical protein
MPLSGIRTRDPSVRASENSSCLRPHGYCDRQVSPICIQNVTLSLLCISAWLIICWSGIQEWQALGKKWGYNERVHQPFIDVKEACDWVRREVFCNILTEFDTSMKLVGLIEMCLKETATDVCAGKHLFMRFLFTVIWNKEMPYCRRFSTLFWSMPLGRFKKTGTDWNWVWHINFWWRY